MSQFSERLDWQLSVEDLLSRFGTPEGDLALELSCDVTDTFGGETVSAPNVGSVVVMKSLTMGFQASSCSLTPQPFPSHVMVWIARGDGTKLLKEQIRIGTFSAVPALVRRDGAREEGRPIGVRFHGVTGTRLVWKIPTVLREILATAQKKGNGSSEVGRHNSNSPLDRLELRVTYATAGGVSVSKAITLPVEDENGAKERERLRLQLTTSSKSLNVGDSIVLHARSNFPLTEFHFLLHSHGQIVTSRRIGASVATGSKLVTFDELVTMELTPLATAVIWMVDPKRGKVVTAKSHIVVKAQKKSAVNENCRNCKFRTLKIIFFPF